MKKHLLGLAVGAALSLASVLSASAASFSFTGTFSGDADVRYYSFSLASASSVTIRSLGYGGGTNAAGQNIAAGGFDSVVALFNGAGTYMHVTGDDDGAGSTVDPSTGAAYDPLFSVSLAAGTYTVALSQSFNFANGPTIADGFLFDPVADAHFTADFIGCGAAGFCDATGAKRSNAFALDIVGVDAAFPTPLPGALPLFATGLGVFGFAAYRRKRKAA
jgi:hypothetical protein